jgi:hypothetical protein
MYRKLHVPFSSSKEYFENIAPTLFEVFPGLKKLQGQFSIRFDIEQPLNNNVESWYVDDKGVRQLKSQGDITLKSDEVSFLKTLNGERLDPNTVKYHLQETSKIKEASSYLHLLLNPQYLHTARMGTLASSSSKEAVFVLSNPGIGLFATLHFCLHIFLICDRYRIKAYCIAPHLYSSESSGGNWLEALLSHRRFNDIELMSIQKYIENGQYRYITHWNNFSARDYQSSFTFEKAHSLFFDNFNVRPSIYSKAHSWSKQNFGNSVLGVHYRGTDKFTEAPRVSTSEFISAINKILHDRKIDTIFVATDELQLRDVVIKKYSKTYSVVSYSELSDTSGVPIHKTLGGTSSKKMEEEFIDSVLLSMCDIALKTYS